MFKLRCFTKKMKNYDREQDLLRIDTRTKVKSIILTEDSSDEKDNNISVKRDNGRKRQHETQSSVLFPNMDTVRRVLVSYVKMIYSRHNVQRGKAFLVLTVLRTEYTV